MSKINLAHRNPSAEDEMEAARLGVSVGVDGREGGSGTKERKIVLSTVWASWQR